MSYNCRYCKRTFVKETSLSVHMCEPKRRYQEQNERGVQLGLQAYLRFYEITQGSAKLKTFDNFVESSYYRAFVKFGRYCVEVKVINPTRFTEWLLKHNKKIDHWCKDSIYTEYLTDYLRVENVNDALARAMEFGIDWAEKSGHPAEDCLRYGNTNAMVYAVSTGRISPWIIYNSESGQKFLAELDVTQIAMIWSYIDADFWMKKFKDYPADQEYAREILQKAGW
jgi:phage antirepressor YoqD-like protein